MAVESIFYSVSGLSCRGALIWDDGVKAPRPLLLMAPNWRGVIKPSIETGQMLAHEGYVVFVADMFGEGNGPVGTEDPMTFLRPFLADVAGMRKRISAALDTLTREADRRAIGDISRRAAIGFCFGGGIVNQLAVRMGPDLAAAVPFYGSQPSAADAAKIKAPLLAHYGELDTRITDGWPAFDAALTQAEVPHEGHIYKGANHGFHNDTTPRYDEAAAKEAWQRTLDWFNKYLRA